MVTTAEDLKAANIDVPIVVGGAALTRKFTDNRFHHHIKDSFVMRVMR